MAEEPAIGEVRRPIDVLLDEYGESHQHPTNKLIHWIAVPIIVVTLVAALWSLPVPEAFGLIPGFNWATILAAAAFLYYFNVSPPLALGFALLAIPVFWGIASIHAIAPSALWISAAVAFGLAWVAQFYGHHVEGKKPSFLKDIQFLLIGPMWLLHFAYQRLSLRY